MRIPLHGKGTVEQKLDLWLLATHMNPKGFRQPPTSRKNIRTHSKTPTTRVEALAREVHGT